MTQEERSELLDVSIQLCQIVLLIIILYCQLTFERKSTVIGNATGLIMGTNTTVVMGGRTISCAVPK